MTFEEGLIQRYFDALNKHDVEGVMACLHEHPMIVDVNGQRYQGRVEVRQYFEAGRALMPDGRYDVWTVTGYSGHGMAESLFRGTQLGTGRVVEALGAEILEIKDGRIKEIRDYHRPTGTKGPDEAVHFPKKA